MVDAKKEITQEEIDEMLEGLDEWLNMGSDDGLFYDRTEKSDEEKEKTKRLWQDVYNRHDEEKLKANNK